MLNEKLTIKFMIEGFETLKLKNLNQPKNNCKYGKWIEKLKDEKPALFKSFELANNYHSNLHKITTYCFYANEEGNKEKALNLFEKSQRIYKNFSSELNYLKSLI